MGPQTRASKTWRWGKGEAVGARRDPSGPPGADLVKAVRVAHSATAGPRRAVAIKVKPSVFTQRKTKVFFTSSHSMCLRRSSPRSRVKYMTLDSRVYGIIYIESICTTAVCGTQEWRSRGYR